MPRISTLNIRHGGGTRVPLIVSCLARSAADILVLTEYRHNDAGYRLRCELTQLGYIGQLSVPPVSKVNTLLVAAKRKVQELAHPIPVEADHIHRFLAFQVGEVSILAAYFPQKKLKYPVFESAIEWLSEKAGQPALFIGDLNTGRHYRDEQGASFIASECFDRIEATGWFDAWRLHHLDKREYSWFSKAQNGFRVDHVFASPLMRTRILAASYDQRPRTEGATDHAMLSVDFK